MFKIFDQSIAGTSDDMIDTLNNTDTTLRVLFVSHAYVAGVNQGKLNAMFFQTVPFNSFTGDLALSGNILSSTGRSESSLASGFYG
jgi:hypothetical protein